MKRRLRNNKKIKRGPCSRTCNGLEEPERDGGPLVAGEPDLAGEAAQVDQGLGRDVVEVDDVADRVEDREEARRAGDDLVELDVRVEGDVLLGRELLELGQGVAAHGQQQEAVAEGQGRRRAPGYRYAHAHYVPQVRVLRHEGVI